MQSAPRKSSTWTSSQTVEMVNVVKDHYRISGRIIGLTCLGLLSASVAGIGVALWKALR
jgi:hypothetical protein